MSNSASPREYLHEDFTIITAVWIIFTNVAATMALSTDFLLSSILMVMYANKLFKPKPAILQKTEVQNTIGLL